VNATLALRMHGHACSPMRAPARYTVAFIMPTKYTMATLPKPENPNVQARHATLGTVQRRCLLVALGRT
jgi:hypothetical protein